MHKKRNCKIGDIVKAGDVLFTMDTEALEISKKQLEASGNMSLERIEEVSKIGVDFISVGALTHSVKAFDISLKFHDI